jgi:predicted AAA+ superfamily ATPase
MDDYHPAVRRALFQPLVTALHDTPVVLLHGARQTGKTTLVREIAHTAHRADYISFDDATTLAGARQDPGGFLAGLPGPVVLDEVQRVPELFLAIKADVDRERRPGRFLLTGSANVLLVPKLSESLAGRVEILTLWPFSEVEIARVGANFVDAVFTNSLPRPAAAESNLSGLLLRGGYPPAVERTDAERREAWFGSYLLTILERDVRDMAHIEGLTLLPRALALIAARSAGLLNFADLSRSLAIPQSTLKRYFALLEAIFLVQLVPAWSTNLGKRLIKAPKLFLNDTGLAASLLGLNEARLNHEAALRGALLENFVAMELRKQSGWSCTRAQLFHFRTAAGQEVDLVLEEPGGAVAGIEVKASATVTGRDFAGLRALADLAGDRFRAGIVLYTGAAAVPFGPHLHALPIGALWSEAAGGPA